MHGHTLQAWGSDRTESLDKTTPPPHSNYVHLRSKSRQGRQAGAAQLPKAKNTVTVKPLPTLTDPTAACTDTAPHSKHRPQVRTPSPLPPHPPFSPPIKTFHGGPEAASRALGASQGRGQGHILFFLPLFPPKVTTLTYVVQPSMRDRFTMGLS